LKLISDRHKSKLLHRHSKQDCQMVHIFSNQKIPIWVGFGGLAMEYVGIFYGLLAYFTAIRYIFSSHLVNFTAFGYIFPFWYIVSRKVWQPWFETQFVVKRLSRNFLFKSLQSKYIFIIVKMLSRNLFVKTLQ
jgi:hypothetical protein